MTTIETLQFLRDEVRKRQKHYIHNELSLPPSRLPDHRKSEYVLDWVVEEIDRMKQKIHKEETLITTKS